MYEVNLRKAEEKDKKDIVNIIKMIRLEIPEFVWDKPEFVEKQIRNGEYFVAETDGKIVGVISLRQRKKTIHIETLAVIPEYRLKKIGTQLVNLAKSFTKEKGLKDLCACSFFEYKIGDFYINQGFTLLDKPGAYNGYQYYKFVTKI